MNEEEIEGLAIEGKITSWNMEQRTVTMPIDEFAELLTEITEAYAAYGRSALVIKRLHEAIEYAIVHAENHDVIRVLDEVIE